MARSMRLTLRLTAIDQMSKTVGAAARNSLRSMQSFQQNAQRIQRNARANMLDSGIAVFGGVQALRYPLEMAANYEVLRVSMQALTGEQSKGNKLFEQTVQLAANTPLELDKVAQVTTLLLGMGDSAETVTNNVKMLGDITALTNGDLNRAAVAYGQASQMGKLLTRDIYQMINAGVPLNTMFEAVYGNSFNIYEQAEKGKLSFEMLQEVLEKSTKSGGQFANGLEKLSATASGVWVRLIDEVGRFAAVFGDSVLPVLKQFGEYLIPIVKTMGEFVKEHKWVAQGTMALVGGFTALAGAAFIVNGAIWIATMSMNGFIGKSLMFPFAFLKGGFMAIANLLGYVFYTTNLANVGFLNMARTAVLSLVPSLSAVTGVMASLNAVMLANPIGLLIAAVAALAVYVGVAVIKWKEFGAAMMLLIGPVGWVVNAFMSMRLHWKSITDAFSGGFLNGIKRLGEVLLDSVLYPLQQILALIEKFTGSDFVRAKRMELGQFRDRTIFTQHERSHSPIMHPSYPGESYKSFRNAWSGIGTKTSISSVSSSSPTNITYSPTVTIGAGATEKDKSSFMEILDAHKEEMARMIQEVTRSNQRRSYA